MPERITKSHVEKTIRTSRAKAVLELLQSYTPNPFTPVNKFLGETAAQLAEKPISESSIQNTRKILLDSKS